VKKIVFVLYRRERESERAKDSDHPSVTQCCRYSGSRPAVPVLNNQSECIMSTKRPGQTILNKNHILIRKNVISTTNLTTHDT